MAVKEDRSLGLYILLSIVTVGIYPLFFIYGMAKDINLMCDGDGEITPGLLMLFIFTILTCGIYTCYWYYKFGNRLAANAPRYGLRFEENGTTILIWLLIGIWLCGVGPFVIIHILCKNMNAMAREFNKLNGFTVDDGYNRNYAQGQKPPLAPVLIKGAQPQNVGENPVVPFAKSQPDVQDTAENGTDRCKVCGAVLRPDAKFCRYCGSKVEQLQTPNPILSNEDSIMKNPERICPNCGATVKKEALFCSKCGFKMEDRQEHEENQEYEVNLELNQGYELNPDLNQGYEENLESDQGYEENLESNQAENAFTENAFKEFDIPELDEKTGIIGDFEKTVLLPREPQTMQYAACLVRKSNGEKTIIDKPLFKIGKDILQVDYQITGNSAVSRKHASVEKTEDGYILRDLDSSNHTFVNGVEIKEQELHDGDLIRFADEEFVFTREKMEK